MPKITTIRIKLFLMRSVLSRKKKSEQITQKTKTQMDLDQFGYRWMILLLKKEKLMDKANSYSGHFSDKRDLEMAKIFKNSI